MTTGTSKISFPKPFSGSNLHNSFGAVAHLQNWIRTETRDGNEVEIDKRPHYFALRLQKSAFDFYRTLTDAQKSSYDETVKAFRTHYTEKPGCSGDGQQDEYSTPEQNYLVSWGICKV